jgi:hypothetical protein
MASYGRRDFAGAAAATTLASSISSGDSTLVLTSATGWPSGTNGDFFVVLDRGTANEEKVLCASRTGTSITVQTDGRGSDGTSAVAHASGATIEHSFAARDFDEANLAVAKTLGTVTTAGDLLVADGANSLVRLARGTTGLPLVAGASSPSYTAVGTTGIADDAITAAKIAAGAVSSSELADDAVTYAKLQNVSATDRLLGRDTTGAGDAEELTVSGGVEFTGSGGIQRSALTGDVTASAGSNTTAISGLALSKLATQSDQTVVGNNAGSSAVPTALSTSTLLTMLGTAGGTTKAYVDQYTWTPTDFTISTGTKTGAGPFTLGTVTIVDPGYDLDFYGVGTFLASGTALDYWTVYFGFDSIARGAIVIPMASTGVLQTFATGLSRQTHTTGSNLVITLKAERRSGSGNLVIDTDAQYKGCTIFYRRAT